MDSTIQVHGLQAKHTIDRYARNISRAEVSHAEIGRAQIGNSLQRINYETIDLKMVKRGIIGVNKVGYVYA